MFDVIDLSARINAKKNAAAKTEESNKARMFLALHAELQSVINRHMKYGATPMNALGATSMILAEALALVDPLLQYPNFRDSLFSFIATKTDDELLKQWMEIGDET
jgi:hypothetical protein